MGQENKTFANEFTFLGLSRNWSTQHWLFVLFLAMYVITLAGNALIITVIWLDPCLDTPMYFFLGNLSFLDICYTTSVVPQMLIHFLAQHKVISFSRCTAQLFVSVSGRD